MDSRDTHHHDGRIGIIDIGSNSIRLVVYDQLKRAPIPLYNEKVMCALGKGLAISGQLNPEGVVLAKPAIARFLAMARNMEVVTLHVIATAAVRDATDGMQFVEYLSDTHDIYIEIISGKREARLGAHGICASVNQPCGLAGDLGGGSMELVELEKGQIGQQVTLPIGQLRLLDETGGERSKLKKLIDKNLESVGWLEKARPNSFYAIGGSFRALAKMYMAETEYPMHILHEYAVPTKELLKFVSKVASLSPEKLSGLPGSSTKRIPALTPSAMVLERVLEITKPAQVMFSASGIREGYLFEQLSPYVRGQDVLLAACTDMAVRIGSGQAYANELFLWMFPLFKDESEAQRRLRMAFCLLSEISLHIHPEYRAEFAFERLTQSSLVGLTHKERVALAIALYHRYQAKLRDDWLMLSLMDEKDYAWAKKLGAAANLAYHLCGGVAGSLHNTAVAIEKDQILLTLSSAMKDTMSDSVRKRVETLKDTLRG